MLTNCPAGLLDDLRLHLEQDWRKRVGNSVEHDAIVQCNVLLALLDFWHVRDDVELLAAVQAHLLKVARKAQSNYRAEDVTNRRYLFYLNAAVETWALDTNSWIGDRQLEAVPLGERVERGGELLSSIFPLWFCMPRRAWCRAGVDMLDQVFRVRSHPQASLVESRIRKLLGEEKDPGGWTYRWYFSHGLHHLGDDALARKQGRLWWELVQRLRRRWLLEHGVPLPRNLNPPIPWKIHYYNPRHLRLVRPESAQVIGELPAAELHGPWIKVADPTYDAEDVIVNDVLVTPSGFAMNDDYCFGEDTDQPLWWRISEIRYARKYVQTKIWYASVEPLGLVK